MPIHIGPFTLQNRLGVGGMGEVWNARHRDQEVDVALKLMTSDRAREERYRESFMQEVRAVASLDHRAIVRVLDSGQLPHDLVVNDQTTFLANTPYLVMELASGTLRDLDGNLNRWTQQRTILLRILDALAHAHARGVIHRDLKPENILLVTGSDGPQLKLADFGLAHAYQDIDNPTFENFVTGTPRFMAPEQILGQWRDQGPWTDLYAVGCLAYWLISGSPPYSGAETEEILKGHLQGALPPLYTTEDLPDGLGQWLQRMMARNPGERFQLASDAAFALRRISDLDAPQQPVAIPFPPPAPHLDDPNFADLDTSDTAKTLIRDADATLLISETITLPDYGFQTALPTGITALDHLPPIPPTWEDRHDDRPFSHKDHLRGVGLGLYGLRQLPMIDRIPERDALWEALKVVSAHQRPLCLAITGTQGVGKTRLASWLTERAQEVGAALSLTIRHSPMEDNSHSLATLVARQIRGFGLSRDALLERLREFMATSGDLDPDLLHDCVALTDLIAPLCDPDYSPERARTTFSSPRERYALITRFLTRTTHRPLILFFDDIQWGNDSLEFLRYLLDQPDAPPLLLIATIRDESLADRPLESKTLGLLQQHADCESLDLNPLTEADHRRLVQAMLGLDSQLAENVVLRTRGNPLFAVQLVGDWVERGILKASDAGFQLRKGASAGLPADISSLLDQRLERILHTIAPDKSDDLFQILELASALGLEVSMREWRKACARQKLSIPSQLLDAMVRARLAILKDDYFIFLHGAIRERLHQHAQLKFRWTSHHRTCADALLDLYIPTTPGRASRAGRHLYRATLFDRAVPFLLEAADEARIASEFSRAYNHFDRLDKAIRKGHSVDKTTFQALSAIRRARTLIKHNHLQEADAALLTLQGQNLPAAINGERHFAHTTLARARGNVQDGLKSAEASIQAFTSILSEAPSPVFMQPDIGLAKALTAKADLLQSAGDLNAALNVGQEAYQRSLNHPNELAGAHLQLGNLFQALGDPDKTLHWLHAGRQAFQDVGNIHGVAQIENSLGEHFRAQGDPLKAKSHYENALHILRRAGVTRHGGILFNLGICALLTGDIPQAEQHFQTFHHELTQAGATGYLAVSQTALMAAAAHHKDYDRARQLLQQSRASIDQTGLVIPDIAELATLTAQLPHLPADLRQQSLDLASLIHQRLGRP